MEEALLSIVNRLEGRTLDDVARALAAQGAPVVLRDAAAAAADADTVTVVKEAVSTSVCCC